MKIASPTKTRSRRSVSLLGIRLEMDHVIVEWLKPQNGEFQLACTFHMKTGAESVLKNPAEAGKELLALMKSNGIREHRGLIILPAAWALTALIELPEMSGEDLQGFLEIQAERKFGIPASDLHVALSPCVIAGQWKGATLAAMPSAKLNALNVMLEVAGIKPVSISLGMEVPLQMSAQSGRGLLQLSVRDEAVDLIAVAGGSVVLLRTLPSSARDLASGNLARELRITLGRLPGELRSVIREATILGPTASVAGMHSIVEPILTPMGMACRPQDPTKSPGDPILFAARKYQHRETLAFEFLKPKMDGWGKFTRRFEARHQRLTLFGVIGVILLPLLAMGIHLSIESHLNRKWSAMKSKVAALEETQSRIRQFRPWFDNTPASVKILNGFISAFPEGGDVWARSVEIKGNQKIQCAGYARNQQVLMSFFDRMKEDPQMSDVQVQQVRGESPIQFTISFNWLESHE